MDTRVRVPIPAGKTINLLQLSAELGGIGLVASDTEVVVAELSAPVDVATLAAKVAAHVADPLYGLAGDDRRLTELESKASAGTLTNAEQGEAVKLLLKRARRR